MRVLRDIVAFFAIAAGAAGPASALTPPIPPLGGLYRVQPGAVVLACGGIIGELPCLDPRGLDRARSDVYRSPHRAIPTEAARRRGAFAFPAPASCSSPVSTARS